MKTLDFKLYINIFKTLRNTILNTKNNIMEILKTTTDLIISLTWNYIYRKYNYY